MGDISVGHHRDMNTEYRESYVVHDSWICGGVFLQDWVLQKKKKRLHPGKFTFDVKKKTKLLKLKVEIEEPDLQAADGHYNALLSLGQHPVF